MRNIIGKTIMRKVMERFYNGDNPPIIDDKPKVTFKQ